MKRSVIFSLMIIMVFAGGCSASESPKTYENKQQVKSIDIKAAKEFMDNYMRYVMKMDYGAMKSFFSEDMKNRSSDVQTPSEPHPVGFKIGEGESKKDKAEFEVHVYNAQTLKPYCSDDTFKYTIIMEKSKMAINKVEKTKGIEVFEKGSSLYKTEGDKVKAEMVASLDFMPQFVVPKGTSSPEHKFTVPREKLGACAISPDGKSIAVTSTGGNTFLGIVSSEDSEQAVNIQQDDKKEGSGGEQKKQEDKSSGNQQNDQNSQSKISIKPVDIFFKSSVSTISYSPDGKMIAVEYVPDNGIGRMNIYKSDSTELVDLKNVLDRFRSDRFSIVKPFFASEGNIIFTVIPIKGATDEEQELNGDWMLEIEGQKLSQIKY